MLFILAFLRVFPLNWQADVLLYGVSWVLLCSWLVASCGEVLNSLITGQSNYRHVNLQGIITQALSTITQNESRKM